MAVIGVQTGGVTQIYGIDGAYRIIKEAGFDAVDANLDELMPYRAIAHKEHVPAFDAEGEESLKYFQPWKDAAEKYGVLNSQAHAPFSSWLAEDDGYNEYLMRMLEKTIAGCAYIGCPRLIIHPFFNGYDQAVSAQEEWERNIDRYTRLIPAAKKHGVMICLETCSPGTGGKFIPPAARILT